MIKRFAGKAINSFVSKTMRSAAQKRALAKAIKASALARKKNAVTATKLTKLSSKISSNKAALNSLKRGTVSVYRIENKRGEGPLMGRKGVRLALDMPTNIKRGYKVAPVSDYNRGRAAILKKLAPKGHPFEEIKFKRGDKFAFSSVKQANKYFSKEEQAFMKTRGFYLVRKDNVNLVGSTATQVTYNTSKDIAKLQKEAIELAEKYKKISEKAKS